MRIPALAIVLAAMLVPAAAAAAHPGPGNGAATITGSFSDGCRDFTARSSKDISHVKLRYVDGRIVKDETIDGPDYFIDGADGDELVGALVKSGTTWQGFKCRRSSGQPTAILEIQTPPLSDCRFNTNEHPTCDLTAPRTEWSRPAGGLLEFAFAFPYPPLSFSFRGTSSTDPDGDLASWPSPPPRCRGPGRRRRSASFPSSRTTAGRRASEATPASLGSSVGAHPATVGAALAGRPRARRRALQPGRLALEAHGQWPRVEGRQANIFPLT